MKSEPASGASPATGPATEGRKARRKAGKKKRGAVEVELDTQKWRHAGWAGFNIVLGALLIIRLGVIAKVVGVFLVLFGLLRAWKFARTLLKPAGTLRVGTDPVALPQKLCVDAADEVTVEDLRQVYFLRRSLPWTQASPVLVVESVDHVYAYPRDWFASDSEQRRVARALAAQLGTDLPDEPPQSPDKEKSKGKGSKAQVIAGCLLGALVLPGGPARADETVRDADNLYQIELPDGWRVEARGEAPRLLQAGAERGVASASLTRTNFPNIPAWRGDESYFGEVVAGLRAATPGFKLLRKHRGRLERVPYLDVSYRRRTAPRFVSTRFLFYRTFTLILATASDRRHRREATRLARSLAPAR